MNDNQAPLQEQGNYSLIQVQAAGFHHTDTGIAAQCDACGLQVSHWPSGIEPFALHAQLSPTCSFILSLRPASINTGLTASTTAHIDDDQSRPQTKLDPLIEANALEMARQHSFSHWPNRRKHLVGRLIEAGFFCCNVGDRVICLYCHLICQGWGDGSDDACAVHKTLSPGCRYVSSMLMGPGLSTRSGQTANRDSAASVDEYLQDSSFINDLKLKQAQWFRNRQAPEPKRTHQESEQMQAIMETDPGLILESSKNHTNEMKSCLALEGVQADSFPEDNGCPINDAENSLRRLVVARVDRLEARSPLKQKFSLSVIKRCWEDQLRLKCECEEGVMDALCPFLDVDFATDTDLWVACTILQKQGAHIQGKKENIVFVRPAMEKIRQSQQTGEVLISPTFFERGIHESFVHCDEKTNPFES